MNVSFCKCQNIKIIRDNCVTDQGTLIPDGVDVFVCFFANLSFFWCLDYSRTNEQIFINIFVGRTWSKEEAINFC